MAEFRFEAIAPDGAEVRDTIEAADHESAENALRGKGLCVYRLRSAGSPLELERRCSECNHVNHWKAIVCATCGAPVRGRRVGPDEHVELADLPDGLVVQENIDGSIAVTKTGWRRWEHAFMWLVVVGWAVVFYLAVNDPVWRWAMIVIGLVVGARVLMACTAWALFARDEWHVGEGFFEQRQSLFGMDWGRTFRAGVIRLELRRLGGTILYRVSVLDRETSRTLCEEYSDSAARALAALLAQRTGWVLDDTG